LNLGKAEISEGLLDLQIRVLSYTADHARQMFGLPLHHRDPFDRQMIAQALAEEMAIVTPEKAFRAYRGVKVIW
jgi:PIN domain nuclease of toxin-antitoxin system